MNYLFIVATVIMSWMAPDVGQHPHFLGSLEPEPLPKHGVLK